MMVISGYKEANKKIAEYEKHIEEVYGNIQFKGKVLKVCRIPRWGRVYGIMCIKLDYTNVDKFYRFNNMSCLKINDNIATFPTNFIGDEGYDNERTNAVVNASYIEVNLNNSRQMIFIDSLGNKFSQKFLDYGSGNLIESDLNRCDDCN